MEILVPGSREWLIKIIGEALARRGLNPTIIDENESFPPYPLGDMFKKRFTNDGEFWKRASQRRIADRANAAITSINSTIDKYQPNCRQTFLKVKDIGIALEVSFVCVS